MKVDLINTIIKMFFINTLIFFVFFKSINYKKITKKEYYIIIVSSIIQTIIYIFLRQYFNVAFSICSLFFMQILIVNKIVKEKNKLCMIPMIVATSIVYATFSFSTIIEAIIKNIANIENYTINFLIIILIEIITIMLLFKIKKFKNGFDFLKKLKNNDYINVMLMAISSVIILLYCLFGDYYGDNLTMHIFISLMLVGIIMIVVIQKTLTMYYKQKLLDDTIKQYEKDLREKDDKIEVLSREKFLISKINHEFFNRQEALLLRVNELSGMSLDVADELDVSDRVQSLSNEFSRSMESIRCVPSLPKSDIPEIDDMFKYMQSECLKNNIDFKLQVNGNIHHLVNSFIPKSKLETLVGDILRDAIRAVSSSLGDYKSIFAILGLKDNFYEFCVFDSGVDFEIDTLIKLGLECVTTHKDNGGSGIGFITTFETMNECNASLVIEEFPNDSKNDYSKSITVRFDGKNEYRIVSYRANEIKEKSKDNRIIIEEK